MGRFVDLLIRLAVEIFIALHENRRQTVIRTILIVVALWCISAALIYSAHAEVQQVKPDLRQEFPAKPAKKTARKPPCLEGRVKIIGVWVIRDTAGNIVAVGALRQRC